MEHGVDATAVAVVAACLLLWGLVSARLERFDVSAPIAFVVMGLVVSHGPTAVIDVKLQSETVRTMAELTLALVLFADASRVNVRALRADAAIPARLLVIGLPLTIAAGTGVAAALLGGTDWWLAASIGAIVAPTDAALGATIMQDPRVPSAVRRCLTVESGLNDGIATPFVNLFLAGAISAEAVHSSTTIASAAVDLVGGAGIGVGVGIVGAIAARAAARAGWSAPGSRAFATLALALLAYATALAAGTNGFVAAFAAGLGFGAVASRDPEGLHLDLTEGLGTLLSLLVWFAFGALMLVPGLRAAGWQDVVFALAALTVVRMVPVWLALLGSGLDRSTVAFVGWFGPRGLASVVFGLLAVDSLDPPEQRVVLGAVTVTVGLSVLLHGVTAGPFTRRYAAIAERLGKGVPEHTSADLPPVRALRGRSPR
ncbi:MAG TPA: cation:proton antiporter [Acidimicrobiales bacterium]|nr:cation:proton antiporter [Acidimicrobiales bacterium]